MLRNLAGCLLLMCFTSVSAAPTVLRDKAAATSPAVSSEAQLEKRLLELGLPAWLLDVDGEIAFEAEEITIGEYALQQVKVPVSLKRSSIEIKKGSFAALDGNANLDLFLDRIQQSFSAKLQLNNVHIETEKEAKTTDTEDEFVFSNTELIPNWTQELRGTINVRAINSQIDDIQLRDVDIQVDSDKSSLTIKANGTTSNGNLQGVISHHYDSEKTNIDVQGQSVPLSLIPDTREYVENIHLDFSVDVVTTGTSARQWVAAMDGQIITEFDDGKFNINKLDKLSQDILSLTLTSLLPISLGRSHSEIECGAIILQTENGMALGDKSIALRTENLAVMGGGKINFAEEQLAIVLHPHARNAGKLNTKTAIKEVIIDGPFQDLNVKPRLGGIINQSISLTTKIANFGLSKIGIPVLDWAAPADVACMKSLQ